MVELDPARGFEVLERHGVVLGLLLGVEQLEHALGRRDAGLHHVDHRRELRERLRELARVLDERLDVADRQLPDGHPQPADERDRDVVQVAEEHHRRLDDPGDELRAVARLEELVVLVVEALLDVALAAEHLHQRVAGERLFDLRVERCRCGATASTNRVFDRFVMAFIVNTETGIVTSATSARSGEIVIITISDADQRERRREQLAQRLLQALREVVDVVGDAARAGRRAAGGRRSAAACG